MNPQAVRTASPYPYDPRWQDPSTIESDVQKLHELIDSFEGALRARSEHHMHLAASAVSSHMQALIKEWK